MKLKYVQKMRLQSIKRVITSTARSIIFLVDHIVATIGHKTSINDPSGVALIRLDAIGDFIVWLDSAKEYRKIYPNKKLTLICSSILIEAAQRFPHWDSTISIDTKKLRSSPLYRLKTIYQISKIGYEIAINVQYSRVLMHGDSLIRATRASQRIGSIGEKNPDNSISNSWYTRLIAADRKLLMELDRNAEFISNLTICNYRAELPRWIAPQSIRTNIMPDDNYIIIFPGASWHGRQWPTDSFSKVAKELKKEFKITILVCGSNSENLICQEIVDSLVENARNLAGKTTLIELAELIRKASLLISNETSAAHLAVSTGTPTVCITGGGHFGRFMPYPNRIVGEKPHAVIKEMKCFGCNWKCTQHYMGHGPVPCISNIDFNDVLNICREILRNTDNNLRKKIV